MPAFFFECYDAHRDLHSFPTRRSSDLIDCRYDPAQDPHVAGGRCEHEITTIGRNSGGPCREAWLVKISNVVVRSALVSVIVGCCVAAGNGPASRALGENPFAPAYGHPYRHGAVATREAFEKMKAWEASRPLNLAAASPLGLFTTLSYGGGVDGIGVTSGTPRVYLVFYGTQWTSGGDPNGAATYLQSLFAGIGTGGELWSGTMTQYCDGPLVSPGVTSCPSGAPHVGYPSGGALAGVWFDTAGPSPSNATASDRTSGGDPNGAATYLQSLFAGIGTGGELWSGTMTQYCDGPLVSPGVTSCPSGAPHVGYPSGGALAGVWFDTAGPSPSNATA